MFDLIIFDCDGVLVDSEPISCRELSRALAEIGLPLSVEETWSRFLGSSLAGVVGIVERQLGRPVPQGFARSFEDRVLDAFRRELRPVPGAVEALAGMPAPVCVASSSSPRRLRRALEVTGLLPTFEGRLFSADEVERGKPAPDLFLHAARSLHANPSRCAVIEDSVPGVRAAVAAGMRAFALAGSSDPADLEKAGARVFREMAKLPVLLASEVR
jgi:HAD superfamily hydrolase (TIGR01509 family)